MTEDVLRYLERKASRSANTVETYDEATRMNAMSPEMIRRLCWEDAAYANRARYLAQFKPVPLDQATWFVVAGGDPTVPQQCRDLGCDGDCAIGDCAADRDGR